MNALAFLRLFARRSVMLTLAGLLVLALIPATIQRLVGSQIPAIFFALINTAVALGLLSSLGGFLGKATAELAGVRLSRAVPGLRRRVNAGVTAMALALPAMTAGFLWVVVPAQFNPLGFTPLWLACMLLFALRLSLGHLWLVSLLEVVVVSNPSRVTAWLAAHPQATSVAMGGGIAALLAMRHANFLPPLRARPGIWSRFTWMVPSHAVGQRARRSVQHAATELAWDDATPATSIAKLVQAGHYERLGRRRTGLWGGVLVSVAVVYGLHGLFVFWAWRSSPHAPMGFLAFYGQLFSPTPANPGLVAVLRGLLMALTAAVGYVAAITLDTSLNPALWHPVSRDLRGRVTFRSHLRQNLRFAAGHLAVALALIATAAWAGGIEIGGRAWWAFLMPAMAVFVFMPIPQAIFPNGAEVFRRKTEPTLQLLAGVVGGTFCLSLIYLVAYLPNRSGVTPVATTQALSWVIVAAVAVYAGYYRVVRWHYARAGLRPRAG